MKAWKLMFWDWSALFASSATPLTMTLKQFIPQQKHRYHKKFFPNRDFKKPRRRLQRKRHIKREICVRLSVFRQFHVGQVVQNKRSALSLAWQEWFSCKGKEWKIYGSVRCRVVVRTSNIKISRRPLADHIKKFHQKACRTWSTVIFPHSTNQIIDLWRCRGRCRRLFLKFPFETLTTALTNTIFNPHWALIWAVFKITIEKQIPK